MIWKSHIEETDRCSESPVPREGGQVNNGLDSCEPGHGQIEKPILTDADR